MAAATKRKRMVVEEVGAAPEAATTPTPLPGNTITDTVSSPVVESQAKIPLAEVKEKVEELHDITEDISESVAKSEDVQEEIVQAVEDASPGSIPSESVHETDSPTVFSSEPPPEPLQVSPPEEPVGVPLPPMPDAVPELKANGGTNPLFIIVPGIFLLGALLGGIYFYQKGTNLLPKTNPEPTPTEVATASAAPSAAPLATVDLTKYPVSILNGSGIPGEAGKVKDILTGGGFKVLTTGNASSYDFTKTVIKAKADVPASFLTQLSSLLSKTYVLDTNQTLAASASDEVQIIVGSTKAK